MECRCSVCGEIAVPAEGTDICEDCYSLQEGGNGVMAKIGICRNCGKEGQIVGDGLHSGCYYAVYNKFTKGTPEYDAALVEAKKRFTDPDYKPRYGKRKKVKPETKVTVSETKQPKHETKAELSIVDQLMAERNRLQGKVFKINQAIELLSEDFT